MGVFPIVLDLFNKLHQNPELSGQEWVTKKLLMDFIHTNTDFEIHNLSSGFYCVYRYDKTSAAIAFRADYDAVSDNGIPKHLCGHDGHSASLCQLALLVYHTKPTTNVIFLFQSAEETGMGALQCLEIFDRENIREIYGVHNLPGFKLGSVLTAKDTFALGSVGIELTFTGKPTHAAYPELGISPAIACGKLLVALEDITKADMYQNSIMCTVIGVDMGEKAFGVAASSARIWLTIRSRLQEDLNTLKNNIVELSKCLCRQNQLDFSITYYDEFPATQNHNECVEKILACCNATYLNEPMRWSEDFGHYLLRNKGAFLGIGAGVDCCGLHTQNYSYPIPLIEITANTLYKLI